MWHYGFSFKDTKIISHIMQAIKFLQHHGIEIKGSDVIFMKNKVDIQNQYFFGRSYTLVDSKNNLSLGEVWATIIYGIGT